MLPYLLVLSFVMFWITLEQKVLNRKSFWLPLIVLALFAGIRSYYVGTDSPGYVRSFINPLDIGEFKFRDDVEVGYQLLQYSILSLTRNYFWLFFITGLIVVYCYLKMIKKYSVNYLLSVFLFITLGTYIFFFNGLRQGLAMAIFVLATPYLLEKRIIPYVLISLLASLFHVSALFMIPFYLLSTIKIKMIYKVLISFFGSLVSSSFLVSYFAESNQRYEVYTEVSEKPGGLLVLSFFAIIMIFIYFISNVYRIKEENFDRLFTFYAVGVAFIIPVAMLGTNPSGPQRLLTYFIWPLILVLPIVFKKINNTLFSSLFVGLILTYFILTVSRFSDLTPYIINPIFEIF
ncbi:EpsG family protein [Psychrobacter frigidicola]|uniref:EpsG family protein n=1 Tax=Psychrobacter frigidicola TaxID=45611 RepID=A0A5C7A6M9_9GAMM|nr:EpsG family protein [Psychrobacter frigidicola]TXD97486.1 EpsG family protein [Psychrobacter frigidicola]